MNSLTPKPTQTTAERPENISKIRHSSALPGNTLEMGVELKRTMYLFADKF